MKPRAFFGSLAIRQLSLAITKGPSRAAENVIVETLNYMSTGVLLLNEKGVRDKCLCGFCRRIIDGHPSFLDEFIPSDIDDVLYEHELSQSSSTPDNKKLGPMNPWAPKSPLDSQQRLHPPAACHFRLSCFGI